MIEIDRLKHLDIHHRRLIEITGADPFEWALKQKFGLGTLDNANRTLSTPKKSIFRSKCKYSNLQIYMYQSENTIWISKMHAFFRE